MRIYLVRHGIAVDREDPDCPPDAQRPLTKEGQARTRQAMEGLRELGVQPDAMLSSPLVRAMQTAKIAAEALGFDERRIRSTDVLLPGAEPARLFAEFARLQVRSVICSGHAPNLDEVLAHAVGARACFTAIKKSGVACLDLESARPGRGTLLWLLPPIALRGLRK